MKIVVTAGGGGHFSPALAVIKKLEKTDEVLFIGRKYAFEGDTTISLEYKTVKELGIPFRTITTGRVQRTVSLRSLHSLLKIPLGLYQSLRILMTFSPEVVFSTGGYIAFPVTIAAFLLRIPVVLHEQTMRAGLANKIAGTFAKKICLSWETSRAYFPHERTVITGNPLREEILSAEKNTVSKPRQPMLFITGGSLGAHAINVLIEEILERLLQHYQVVHQTGDAQEYRDFARLETLRETLSEERKQRYTLMKFVTPQEITTYYQQASLVIARSGMNTVLEILYFQKPALLIPLPHGQKNEQMQNAMFLKHTGLARVKNQKDVTPETLYTEIEEMMAELPSYQLTRKMPSVIQKDAAEKIIATLLSVTEKFSSQTHQEAKS